MLLEENASIFRLRFAHQLELLMNRTVQHLVRITGSGDYCCVWQDTVCGKGAEICSNSSYCNTEKTAWLKALLDQSVV